MKICADYEIGTKTRYRNDSGSAHCHSPIGRKRRRALTVDSGRAILAFPERRAPRKPPFEFPHQIQNEVSMKRVLPYVFALLALLGCASAFTNGNSYCGLGDVWLGAASEGPAALPNR